MMATFSAQDIDAMEQRYRAHFINGLSGFKSANLIGTRSNDRVNNLCIVSSVFHLGANPPLMGMMTRPHTVRRDTLENIQDTGEYTINHVHKNIIKPAHQSSARYEADEDEFSIVGLTPEMSPRLNAPYVAESLVKFGLTLEEIVPVKQNNTEIVIGRIQEVHIDPSFIREDGFIDLDKAGTVAVSGLDNYHACQTLMRLSYAKPDKPLDII